MLHDGNQNLDLRLVIEVFNDETLKTGFEVTGELLPISIIKTELVLVKVLALRAAEGQYGVLDVQNVVALLFFLF